jgi:hypothetical protein
MNHVAGSKEYRTKTKAPECAVPRGLGTQRHGKPSVEESNVHENAGLPSRDRANSSVADCETFARGTGKVTSVVDSQSPLSQKQQPHDAPAVAATSTLLPSLTEQLKTTQCDASARRRKGAQSRRRGWSSFAINPVQPVWCAAPRPLPVSPWKNSWNGR